MLWNCTSCGACVQQCPVDIEHVDHIMDMRRHQVLVESNFPAELNQLFKGLENKGNPWNMSSSARMDWAKGLDFDVPVVGEDLESLESVDWLFWVGCAGAYEDRAKKTTRAVAELLDIAGISFGVLGNGETCTGDPARRAGNEFVFQGLAMQNVETFKEYKVKKVVSTCAHCFNTLKNEYKDFGIELEVVHHTQLLNRLVREGKLTPVKEGAGAAKRSITYHDPCYLGRHNEVYSPPRELLQVLPGAEVIEMERNSERSFCCGAGGARMWMEENLGERINVNRTKEAVGTGADQIAVGCPFCRVMLSDGLTAQQAKGEAREEVEVLDVAQMLLASVKGEQATKAAPGSAAAAAPPPRPRPTRTWRPRTSRRRATSRSPRTRSPRPPTPVRSRRHRAARRSSTPLRPSRRPRSPPAGGSLFDTPAPEPAAEKPASGGSLFDLGPAEPEPAHCDLLLTPAPAPATSSEPAANSVAPVEETPAPAPAKADLGSGGSLFDIAAPEPTTSAAAAAPQAAEPEVAEPKATEPQAAAAQMPPVAEATVEPASTPVASGTTSTPTTDVDLAGLGSLFDLEAPAAQAAPAAEPAAVPEPEPSGGPATEATDQNVADAPPTTGTTSAPATDVDLSSIGSLFDIPAPEVGSVERPRSCRADRVGSRRAIRPSPTPTPEPEVSGGPATEPTDQKVADAPPAEEPATPAAPSAPPSGADLSKAALFADADDAAEESPTATEPEPAQDEDPDTILDAEADSESEPEPEPEPAAKAADTDAPGHTPRTDVDISGSGSLFDL